MKWLSHFRRPRQGVDHAARQRLASNRHARQVHEDAGNRWYPHEMANGDVRWYDVHHEYAMDM